MEFITTEQMKKYNDLGYTFTDKYTPNNLGRTYHVIVTDKDGNEVVHTSCSYANGSGHGYAMSGAQRQAVEELEAIINGEVEEKQEYDIDFLYRLLEEEYITEYGYTTDGELLILFDSWSQVEGEDERTYVEGEGMVKTGNFKKSVYAKLCELADKKLLKPSINKTIKEVEYSFTDSYSMCDGCGKLINTEWEGVRYIERTGEVFCNDCINESEEAIESLIEEAKDDFSKALPVMISENKLEEMGYSKLDEETDFSTRSYQWGEESWSCHNINHTVIEELCKKYDGFPKLTGVFQFDAEYNAFFPNETVEQARLELEGRIGIGSRVEE